MKLFYESCMDTATIRRLRYRPAVDFISRHFSAHLSPDLGDTGDLTDVIHGDVSDSCNGHFY